MDYNTSPSSSAFNIPPPPSPRSAVEISYDSFTTLTTRITRAASTATLNKPRWFVWQVVKSTKLFTTVAIYRKYK